MFRVAAVQWHITAMYPGTTPKFTIEPGKLAARGLPFKGMLLYKTTLILFKALTKNTKTVKERKLVMASVVFLT